MKKYILIILLCCVLGAVAFSIASLGDKHKPSVSMMSYNVRNGIGMDNVRDLHRVAQVIKNAGCDVVAVQELDSVTTRSDSVDILGELARLCGMHAAYGAAIDYRGGKYGVGILSVGKPLSYYNIPLPGREEKRTILIAEFPDYVFCCTHLSLTEEDRLASLQIITEELSRFKKPVFLAGDFNAGPGGTLISELRKHFRILSDTELATFPAGKPEICIDYITVMDKGKKIKVSNNTVDQQTTASDHCPLWLEATW